MYHLILLLVIGSAFADIDPLQLLPKDDIEKTIKAKCETNGGAQAYDNLDNAKDTFRTCVEAQINVTAFQEELKEARKTGSMDEVFGKYCAKTPAFKTCVKNLTDTLKQCLDDNEKSTMDTVLEVLKKLGEFLCYNDGDRLAMFIAEGGVKCIQEQVEGIKTCGNSTFYHKIPTEITANTLPQLSIGKESCDDLNRLKECVVTELEKCESSTPANIIEALFKFIHRNACKNRQR